MAKTISKRYNKVPLGTLNTAVKNKEIIDISNQDEIKANKIIIIKRKGHKEPFSPKKLAKVLLWACPNQYMREDLLRDTEIKLHKEIRIQDMYNQLIVTAVNKICMLNPEWEIVAAKLQVLSYYKETYNISNHKIYPSLPDIINKGIEKKIYDKDAINTYSETEILMLNKTIKQERDLLFNYKGLVTFFNKYCLNHTKTKKLELPQIAYMRVAMALMLEEKEERIKKVIALYDAISQHQYTVATPIMLNALTPGQQLSSCVLNTLADDSNSILDTGKNLGIYSKFKGGTALDISAIRASGSYIEGTQGYSSGPVRFLKYYEGIMKAWNQGGKRPGALAIYFPWWHIDVLDILSLKSNGGTDENRARGLMYALKINKVFIDAIIENKNIFLFDPKDTTGLLNVCGQDFEDAYYSYIGKSYIRKKKINARELWAKTMKERSETGNIYLYHEENVNNASLLNRYIGSSNLCTEIVLPSKPSELINEELFTMEDGDKRIVKRYTAGEVALCNLSSINLEKWFYLTDQKKMKLIRTLIRGLDNTVDIANYPVKEAKNSNMMYRYLGIGVLNFANYLALHKLVIDSQAAMEETDRLFDEISYLIISASVELAQEKGKFEKFYETEWSNGILPIHKANHKAVNLTDYTPDMQKWNSLAEKIQKYGIRNAQLMAIAPTATSGKAINAIESTEPIADFFYKEEGTITVPTIVPNFKKNNKYYKKSFECDQYALIEQAAIRQKWLDQAQSINMYLKKPDSLMEMTKLHFYGFSLGIKTFYYLKQQKDGADDTVACDSCT
ncbi:MAG: ribonucleoside-diphosphate reductase subunit alpha [bacterium]|nr:ribonucleoside-diphosphate reductase subunit alpha [bacterium]